MCAGINEFVRNLYDSVASLVQHTGKTGWNPRFIMHKVIEWSSEAHQGAFGVEKPVVLNTIPCLLRDGYHEEDNFASKLVSD